MGKIFDWIKNDISDQLKDPFYMRFVFVPIVLGSLILTFEYGPDMTDYLINRQGLIDEVKELRHNYNLKSDSLNIFREENKTLKDSLYKKTMDLYELKKSMNP